MPPRLPPLRSSDLSAPARDICHSLFATEDASLPDPLPITAAVLLHHPSLYAPYFAFSRSLMHGALTPRQRELAILRNAWILQAPFEWGEHVLAGKAAGLTSDEIAAIIQGADAPSWSVEDRAILRATEELHEIATISDETWARLELFLDDRQLIELPVLVGWYACVAFAYNSLRMPMRPENKGLAAR